MDWAKTKNILIVALIATNIFLVFTYFSKNDTEDMITDRDVLYSVLKEKNIFIDTEIPEEYDKMSALTIEYNYDYNKIIEENLKKEDFNLPVDSSEEKYHEKADEFLEASFIGNENLLFDSVVIKDDEVVVKYKNRYKEIVIGDSFFEVTFANGKIKNATRKILNIEPHTKKKLKVISPEEALLIFMGEKKSQEEYHIEKMQLVSWINSSNFNGEATISDTAFPTWEITYNDGEIEYIVAYKS